MAERWCHIEATFGVVHYSSKLSDDIQEAEDLSKDGMLLQNPFLV